MNTLYVDDSMLGTGIQQKIIAEMKTEQPPVIIINNWAYNGTEISRFKTWATEVMDYVASEYLLLKRYDTMELYVLRRSLEERAAGL